MSAHSIQPPAESPLKIALRGARENLVPGLILQAFAIGLVVAYYQVEAVRGVVDQFTALRERLGFWLPMITTAVFGCVIPQLYLRVFGGRERHASPLGALVLFAFWFYKGLEVDLLYRGLARLFGEGTDVATIAAKTVADQLIYCPILAIPVTVVVYGWVAVGLDARLLFKERLAPGWYRRETLPLLISTWGVWIPAVCIIYTLPTPLQLPMQNLVLCFFTLLVETLSRRKTPARNSPENEVAQAAI
jgi:hypothetical protein